MLLLESTLKKLSPINDCEKVDLLISAIQEQRIPHTNEVELQVLYAIRKSKIQLYFKEQWQKMGPTIKSPTTSPAPSPTMPKVASKPVQPAPFQGKKHKKKMKKNAHLMQTPMYAVEDELKSRAPVANPSKSSYFDRRQERLERNRDKRVEAGHSSTGVPLPTAQALKEHKEKRQHHSEVYYANKHLSGGESKRGCKHFFINTPMQD